ncbi:MULTISPECIES: hypothetical protein [Vibrio harveyi group]|uniref:hypothetical protein n=1 Tax=Vibrio harveyi group TaxID=717610 RepID=UPI000CE3F82D|nr:hypothetical protein [Vibrio jasicida]
MKHSIYFINKPDHIALVHFFARQKDHDSEYVEYEMLIQLEGFDKLITETTEITKELKKKINEKVQSMLIGHAIDSCYSVVIFHCLDVLAIRSLKNLKLFHAHRKQLLELSFFSIDKLLEHESISGLPISKSLTMSQLMYLIARYSAPGITLSSLTKQEAASRLNLKATQLDSLLAKLIKAELISIQPFSFIAPTQKFWDSGSSNVINKMMYPQLSGLSATEVDNIEKSAHRFISHFNALKVHNLSFSYERRMHALKNFPPDIRGFFQLIQTNYVQSIKMKVLTIEKALQYEKANDL